MTRDRGLRARLRALAATAALAAMLGAALLVPTAGPASAGSGKVDVPVSFSLTGSGWGHGVGLSQYGAYGMALAGFTASDIVRHYYTGTTVAAVRDDVRIRVNLLHGAAAVTLRSEAVAAGGGGLQVKVKAGPTVLLGIGDRVRLVRRAEQVRVLVRPRAGGKQRVGSGAAATVRWSGTDAPGRAGEGVTDLDVGTTMGGLKSGGHRYRDGLLKVTASPGRTTGLEAVNTVRVRDYLEGIAEVPSSWPAAALQAQVLAARSYALSKLATGIRSACRCHVDDGGGPYYDQTFVGTAKVSGAAGSRWANAVAATSPSATAGMAVLYEGRPITAFYSSSTGGRTQASKDVWGGDLPYARSVDDHWSQDPAVENPYASWTRTASERSLATLFGLADVVSLDVSDVTAGDALANVTASSSKGVTATVKGATFASRLGLPSRWVTKAKPVSP